MKNGFVRGALLPLVLSAGVSSEAAGEHASTTPADGAVRSPAHKVVQLANGLRVSLVSDPDAAPAAVALAVGAGLLHDPPERPGASHLLEHLVLSAQAGEADSLVDYVRARRGQANARTTGLLTEYYLSLGPEFLPGALARLAAALEAAHFTPADLRRELAAVDAEFAARSRSPQRRELAVHRQAVNPSHPWSRSFGGNASSLGAADAELAGALRDFFTKHYTPQAMALTVVAPRSLDALEQLVRRHFATLSGQPAPRPPAEALIAPGSQPWLTQIRARGSQVLSFWFPVQARPHCEAIDAHAYVSSLLGSEGQATLAHELRSRGWIRQQKVSRLQVSDESALVNLRFLLSPSGQHRVVEIGDLLFAYLALVGERGMEPARLAEWNHAADLRARYPHERSASDQARAISRQALDAALGCPPLSADDVIAALGRYTPDNLFVAHIHPHAPAEREALHYPVRFHQGALPAPWLTRWQHPLFQGNLRLPSLSPYDPGSTPPPERMESEAPIRITHGRGLQLWYSQDAQFHSPRGWLQMELSSPGTALSALEAVHFELLAAAFATAIEPQTELGRTFDYAAEVDATPSGIEIRISGFAGAFAPFTTAVLEALTNVALDEPTFRRYAAAIRRRHDGVLRTSTPVRVLETELRNILLTPAADQPALAAASRRLTYREFTEWHTRFAASVRGRALVVGGLSRDQATALAVPMRDLLRAGSAELPPARADARRFAGPAAMTRRLALQHPDVAVARHLRAPDDRIETHAAMGLLGPLLNRYMKSALRDQEQLAYLVAVKPAPVGGVPGAVLTVQSPRASAEELLQAIGDHLNGFDRYLRALPDESFARFRDASLQHLLRRPASLEQVGTRAWRDMTSYGYESHPRERIGEIVPRLTRNDMSSLYRAILDNLDEQSVVLVSPGMRRR